MVNITSLQDYITDHNNWKYYNVLSIFGVYGSGVDTVLKELSKFEADDLYIHINNTGFKIGFDKSTLKSIRYQILEVLDEKRFLKKKDYEEDLNDFNDYYNSIKRILGSLQSQDSRVIVMFSGFDTYNNLSKEFMSVVNNIFVGGIDNKVKTRVIFSFDRYMDKNLIYNSFYDLSPNILSNSINIKGFQLNEIIEVLSSAIKNTRSIAMNIFELCGGNPEITERILDVISEYLGDHEDVDWSFINDNYIKNNFEIDYLVEKIYKSFRLEDLEKYSQNKKIKVLDSLGNFMKSSGLLISYNSEENLKFNSLFENKLLLKNHKKITQKSYENFASITLDSDKLSSQEYKVYRLFQDSKGELVTKSQIAEVMWGKNKGGKKKDWAIDQLMKRLRGKISDKDSSIIQTVRGRGYRLSQ